MSITMNTSSQLFLQTDTAQGLKTIGLANSQMEIEGQMVLQLIQSASAPTQQSSSSATLGGTVNIKV
jgi:hypothetical protein